MSMGRLWGHMGACTRKRGAFKTFRSVSDAYDLWGRSCAKEGCIMDLSWGASIVVP